MIGGKHIQRGTNRVFTYNAFLHTDAGPIITIYAIVLEGENLLDHPTIELLYQPSHGSVADVVTARMVRYMNDTRFGVGKPPEKRFDWTDFGPWK